MGCLFLEVRCILPDFFICRGDMIKSEPQQSPEDAVNNTWGCLAVAAGVDFIIALRVLRSGEGADV